MIGLGGVALSALAGGPGKSPPSSLNDLSLEVSALQALYYFKITPAQMEKLKKLAKDTADDTGARLAPKASDTFRQTLLDLRTALVKADNDELIDKLQEKLEDLRDAENPELDEGFEVTDAAHRKAPEVLQFLSARQVAAYLAAYGEQFPDPLEHLLDTLGKVRGLSAKEWKQTRESVSEEIGRLAAGLDSEKADEIAEKVVQLLIQARALTEDEFKKQRPELEKTARQIVGNVGPFDVLRHSVERALAELLANPRLVAAIDARLKK
jgi:hypothetical protein